MESPMNRHLWWRNTQPVLNAYIRSSVCNTHVYIYICGRSCNCLSCVTRLGRGEVDTWCTYGHYRGFGKSRRGWNLARISLLLWERFNNSRVSREELHFCYCAPLITKRTFQNLFRWRRGWNIFCFFDFYSMVWYIVVVQKRTKVLFIKIVSKMDLMKKFLTMDSFFRIFWEKLL